MNIFSVNIPTAEMMGASDFCGIYSSEKFDKSKMFNNSEGKLGTPLIYECPVSLECKVAKEVIIKNRHIFIAEVLETFIDEDYAQKEDGRVKIADMKKLNPLIYSLDNKYYTIGDIVGDGYKEGKKV